MADLDVLFEACLARLEAGGSIEDCLATYPAEAANLSPLLQIVTALHVLGRSRPVADPAAAQAARTRFLEEAQALGQQTPVSIEEAMQACLAMLAAGSTPEQCLGAFPQHAAALQPILPTLAALQSTGRPAPMRSLSQVATHRQEFLAAAARYAKQQEQQVRREPEPRQSRWAGLAGIFQLPAFRWAAILFVVALLVFTAGRITVSAASAALPGDALYPVKLATERLALALTLDDLEHQNLVRELEQRRREEAEAVAAQRRAVDSLTVPGTVASLSGELLNVDGVPVIVPPQATIVGTPGPGQKVVVKASSDRSGKLVAQAVEYQGALPAPPAAVAAAFATATPVASQAAATPAAALAPTRSFTATLPAVVPAVTVTSVATGTLPVLPGVTMAPAAGLTGTAPFQPAQPPALATAIATSTLPLILPALSTPALAPTGVATVTLVLPTPTLAAPTLEPATAVPATPAAAAAPPALAMTTTVAPATTAAVVPVQPAPEATATPALLLPATVPLVQPPPESTVTPALSLPATAPLVQPPPQATAENALPTSAPARPTFVRRPTQAPTSSRPLPVTVSGVVERITSSGWIVGNTRVTRSSSTRVDQSRGAVAVGAQVRVSGVRQPGSILATRVVVLKPAQSGVAPTRVLPPLLLPLARPTPPAEPTSSETSSAFPTVDLMSTPLVELTALPPPAGQTVLPPTPALPLTTPTPAAATHTFGTPPATPQPPTPTPALLPSAAAPNLPRVAPTLNRPGATLRPPRATPRLLPRATPRPPRVTRRTPTPTPRSLLLPSPTGAPLPLP